MLVGDKIDQSLRAKVDYNMSEEVRKVLVYPYDFYRSIEYALSVIGKHVRIMEKTIFVPMSSHYTKIDLTKLCKENIRFVRPLAYGYTNISSVSGKQRLREIQETGIEELEVMRKGCSTWDWFFYNEQIETLEHFRSIALKHLGSDMYLKSRHLKDNNTVGKFDKISSISGVTINVVDGTNATLNGYCVNLSLSDSGLYDYVKITNISTNALTSDSDKSTTWSATDKLYFNADLPKFIVLTFQACPMYMYFSSDSDVIPCPDDFIEEIDDLASKYLFDLLITRDDPKNPVWSRTYTTKLKLGLILPEDKVISNIKRRLNAHAQPFEIPQYQVLGRGTTRYGR